MIKNRLQYGVTYEKIAEFKAAVAGLQERNDIKPVLKEIQANALTAQIELMEEEIDEYSISMQQPNIPAKA
jgi:hypothetical protein